VHWAGLKVLGPSLKFPEMAKKPELIDRNRNAQVSRWNGRCILARAFVLAIEQSFHFSLQIAGLAIFLATR
jgi:hypothetical protein